MCCTRGPERERGTDEPEQPELANAITPDHAYQNATLKLLMEKRFLPILANPKLGLVIVCLFIALVILCGFFLSWGKAGFRSEDLMPRNGQLNEIEIEQEYFNDISFQINIYISRPVSYVDRKLVESLQLFLSDIHNLEHIAPKTASRNWLASFYKHMDGKAMNLTNDDDFVKELCENFLSKKRLGFNFLKDIAFGEESHEDPHQDPLLDMMLYDDYEYYEEYPGFNGTKPMPIFPSLALENETKQIVASRFVVYATDCASIDCKVAVMRHVYNVRTKFDSTLPKGLVKVFAEPFVEVERVIALPSTAIVMVIIELAVILLIYCFRIPQPTALFWILICQSVVIEVSSGLCSLWNVQLDQLSV